MNDVTSTKEEEEEEEEEGGGSRSYKGRKRGRSTI